MNLSTSEFLALVAHANLAPSVHNTQPTRWRLEPDGRVLVVEAVDRTLPVGDPQGRDADVSHGAAIEGFSLACNERGMGVVSEALSSPSIGGLRPVARLRVVSGAARDALSAFVPARRTYRGAFMPADASAALNGLACEDDVILVRAREGVAQLASLNDAASLRTFRNGAFRAELLSWMRLARSHPQWALDGLNAEAMHMSPFEAAGASVVLRPNVFEVLDRLGIAHALVGEAQVVRSASAIALFHRPATEPALETGRRFHRLWLHFTAAGLSASPMAVLADDLAARAAIARDFGLPDGRRLITGFRLGYPPKLAAGPKPRLPPPSLLV